MKPFRTVVDSEVRFSLPADHPCPCGTGLKSSACCLTPRGFRKLPAVTTPPGAKTGVSIEGCYASPLGDCGRRISREHYVSESLLHLLNQNHSLTVQGLPWVENEPKVVSPKSLAAKILCDRHNSALAPLDAIAVSLFRAFDEQGAAGSDQRLLYLFSGYDIERWLLKALCGISCSKSLTLDSPTDISIRDYWLDILFSSAQFPGEQGLYVCKSTGHRFEGPHGVGFRAITGRGQLSGLGFLICGYELVLSMSGFPSRSFDGRDFAYRPMEFYSTAKQFEKSVVMTWDGHADLGTVSLEIVETQQCGVLERPLLAVLRHSWLSFSSVLNDWCEPELPFNFRSRNILI